MRCGFRSTMAALSCLIGLAGLFEAAAAEPATSEFAVERTTLLRELSPDFCWFHPRAAVIPGAGRDAGPLAVVTLQKHLRASDHYSGLYYMRSDDGGRTWTPPKLPPQLDWRKNEAGETIAVCDVTPGWHAPSGRLLAIGIKLRYSPRGDQLLDRPRSHECAYAVYDPKEDAWSEWRMLDMPDTAGKFFLASPGCVQWLVDPDGSLLVPLYFRGPAGGDYATTVVRCRFDGRTLSYVGHGSELALKGGRGLYEPSLARFGDRYYLTLRNDARGYVTTSADGLKFDDIKPWKFDDGADLGSYNTQAHWAVGANKLWLAYTRRGADNDHIPRHRAPIFVARVDPEKLHVVRSSEQPVLPERGVMLGNFGVNAVDSSESWVTDAEYLMADKPHPRGADGTVWLGRLRWKQ